MYVPPMAHGGCLTRAPIIKINMLIHLLPFMGHTLLMDTYLQDLFFLHVRGNPYSSLKFLRTKISNMGAP